jgi:hypothetical protein
MRPARHFLLAAAIVAMPAMASPYDQAWSVVESGGNSEVRKESRLAVTKVDGSSTRDPRRSGALSPGKHVITVRFESVRGHFNEKSRDLQIDLEPCTRYRIVAAYESKTGPDWMPRVASEPIGECRAKFAAK